MFIESRLMLLDKIKPIRYKRHNIIMEEIKEIKVWEEFPSKRKNIFLAKKPARPPAARGLKIQFDISKTMQDTWRSLIK